MPLYNEQRSYKSLAWDKAIHSSFPNVLLNSSLPPFSRLPSPFFMAETGAPLPYDYDILVAISHHLTAFLVVRLRPSDLSWREMLLETCYTRILSGHKHDCLVPPENHRTTGRIWSHPNLTTNEVAVNPEILFDYRPSDSAIALDINRDGKSFVSDHIPKFPPPTMVTEGDYPLAFIVEFVDDFKCTALLKRRASGDIDCKRPNKQQKTSQFNFRRVGQHLLVSLGPEQRLPSPRISNIQQLLAQEGVLLVDKTRAVSVITDPYSSRIIILRRPRGFGMKTFLSMVSQVYDDLSSPALIEALYPEDARDFPQPFPVLHLDLSKVSADASTVAQSLHEYVNSAIRQMWLKYDDIYGSEDVEEFLMSTPGDTLALATAPYVTPALHTLLIVENYDSPVFRARPDDRAAVLRYMDTEFFSAVVGSQGNFVRTILTSEVVTDEYTGIHLDRLERFAIDLTHDAAMQEVFGFTEKEIRALDGALEGKNPAAGDVIQDLHERGIESSNFNTSSESRYDFSGSTDAVYSMQEVLDVLGQRIGKPNRE